MATALEQQNIVREVCKKYRSLPPTPLAQLQKQTSRDAPAKGAVWIARTAFLAPEENDLRGVLYIVCDKLKQSYHQITSVSQVPLLNVRLEFIGSRAGVFSDAPEPEIPELAKLQALERDCESDFTILYVHGGGLYFSSPAEYRSATTRLARATKARVASISYRLTPQNTFPGPVLDILVAYASLLYPPPGSSYSAVPADRIILAGNSAGATLCFALTKFLLEFNKHALKQPLQFHGRQISLPLPAGLMVCSAWADCCDVMPSWLNPDATDILGVLQHALLPGHPKDEIWPSSPSREHLYCSAATLDHELVSPAAVKDWTGSPPMWFSCGSLERGVDGNRLVASQAARCGVTVQWNEYRGMMHEFMIILGSFPQSKHCFEAWSKACTVLAAGKMKTTFALSFKMPNCADVEDLGDVCKLSPLSFE